MAGRPDEFDRLWAWFVGRVSGSAEPRPRAVAVGWAVIAAFATLLAVAPALVITDMPHDALIPLDGAWRMASGQRPHHDFLTPVGDLYYALLALGAALRGPLDPRLLAATNALVGLPVLALALAATRWRLPEPLRTGASVGIALLAMSPRTLDDVGRIGFNAMYNRWSWALASIALLGLLLEPEDPRDPRRVRAGEVALIGVVTLATFWTKVTFVPLIVLGAALAVVASPRNRGTALAGVGLGLAASAVSAVTPIGTAYLADLRIAAAAGAGGPGLIRTDALIAAVGVNQLGLFGAIGVAFALLRTGATDEERARAGRVSLALLGLVSGSLVVASQNNDRTVPVLVVGTLLAVAALRARPSPDGRPSGSRAGLPIVAVLAAAQLAWPVWLDARAITVHAAMGLGRTVPLYADAGSPLHGLRAPDVVAEGRVGLVIDGRIPGDVYDNLNGVSWPVDIPVVLADAVALIDAHGLRDRRIASLTFSPYFPYLLGAPPPRGLPAWWDWQRTFGPDWDRQACEALADSEVVLEPKVWNITGIHEENAACLASAFDRRDETALWIVWVRR